MQHDPKTHTEWMQDVRIFDTIPAYPNRFFFRIIRKSLPLCIDTVCQHYNFQTSEWDTYDGMYRSDEHPEHYPSLPLDLLKLLVAEVQKKGLA